MVNRLLTISIKVNVLATVESQIAQGTDDEEEDSRLMELASGRRLVQPRRQRLRPNPPDFIGRKINALLSARRVAGAFVLRFSEWLVARR